MKTQQPLRRSLLGIAALLALMPVTPATFAFDFNFSTGNFAPGVTAPEPLLAGQVLQINSGGNKFFNGVTLTNQTGLVNWNADTLYLQNGTLINNQSIWDAKGDNALINNGGATSTFNNSGTFRKSAGAGSTSIGTVSFVNSGTIDAQTGTIAFSGSNATFNAGSVFTGAGSVLISSSASFNGGLTSVNLTLSSGSFTGTTAKITGVVNYAGGYMQGNWQVASGQTLAGVTGGNKFLNGVAITNGGTVNWQTTDTLYFQNSASFTNNGLHDIQSTSSLVNNGGGLSTYTNASGATVRVSAAATAAVGTIAFVNDGGTLTANGTLNYGGGNATFNNGTVFNGGGSNLVTNNAAFNGAFTSVNLTLSGGSYTGTGASITGGVNFSGGYLQGDWTVAGGQVLVGRDGGNKFINGGTLTNKGTVAWQTANALYVQNASNIDNQSLFDMQTGTTIVNNGGALSTFTNSGTMQVAAGQDSSIGAVAFVNNAGVLNVGAGGSLNFGGGNANFNAGTQFTGAGVNKVTNNAAFNGGFGSSNLTLSSGLFIGTGAVANGSTDYSGGYLQGDWRVAAGAALNVVAGGSKFLNGGAVTNQGTIAVKTAETLYFQNNVTLANPGTINLRADSAMVFNGGAVGTFVNTGLIVKSAGTGTSTIGNNLGFDNQGVVDVATGTIRLPDNFANKGTLKGVGTFATDLLTNSGHVAPGESPGTLRVAGNFAQTSLGSLDIQTESLTSFDKLIINGNASLAGTLALSCFGNCSYAVGDTFTILDASANALSGTFASITLSGYQSGQFQVIYDAAAGDVMLKVTQATVAAVPEPGSWGLMLAGLAAIGGIARRRRGGGRRAPPRLAQRRSAWMVPGGGPWLVNRS